MEPTQAVMVALDARGAVVGTYYLTPNSLCLGAHVANAGYVVAEQSRRLGLRAMQFILVVSTSTAGIRCWQRNGAFRSSAPCRGSFATSSCATWMPW